MADVAPTAEAAACVFCEIVADRAPATIVARTGVVTILVPLGPVVPGTFLAFGPDTNLRRMAAWSAQGSLFSGEAS